MAPERRIEFRVGINLGDVIADEEDIHGDGVNVAARLQALAEPGGLAVSGSIHDQVRDRLALTFEDCGEQEVKNIARPVRVFALSPATIAALPDAPDAEQAPARAMRHPLGLPLPLGALVAAVLIGAIGVGAWALWPTLRDVPASGPAVTAAPATPATAIASPRLSLVVLPFTNLSGDPEQDYFADGLVEDLTTDLSRIPGAFVIARNTAFTYKGKPVDVREVGRDLGVRYALEGSVRRIGDQVRVNAQLVDTQTGGHLWADRFEGKVENLAELQSEITGRLARALDLELTEIESERGRRERPDNPDAVDLTFRGWAAVNAPDTRENSEAAIGFFEQALAIDPDHVNALVGLGNVLSANVTDQYSSDPAADLDRADAAIAKAIAASPRNAEAYLAKGNVLLARKMFDDAAVAFDRAIALNPNLAPAYASKAINAVLSGRSAEAFALVDKAMRLSPQDPELTYWHFIKCHAHSHLGQHDAAIEECRKSVALSPYWLSYIDLISAYGWKGMRDEARAAIAELEKLMPGYTVRDWASINWSDDPTFKAEYARIVEGLRKAGMREE